MKVDKSFIHHLPLVIIKIYVTCQKYILQCEIAGEKVSFHFETFKLFTIICSNGFSERTVEKLFQEMAVGWSNAASRYFVMNDIY